MNDDDDRLKYIVADLLHESEPVKRAYLAEMQKSEELKKRIEEVVNELEIEKSEEQRKRIKKIVEELRKDRPKITEKRFWMRFNVVNVIIGLLFILSVTGLTWWDVIQPRELSHRLLATDNRIAAVLTGNPHPPGGAPARDEIADAIRTAVSKRPFLVFQGWRVLDIVADESDFSEECLVTLADIRSDREFAETVLNNATDEYEATPTFTAGAAKLQAENDLKKLEKKEADEIEKCIEDVIPSVSFSFYANLERDSVKIILRALTYQDGSGLRAINSTESGMFKANLAPVSLNDPQRRAEEEGVALELRFVSDGLLETRLTNAQALQIINKNDRIHHLKIRIDRENIQDFSGHGFVVGAVVELNTLDDDGS